MAISTVINIILDLIFVIVFHWDVAGVAWATIIAQLFSFLFGIRYLNKRGDIFTLSIRDLEFDSYILKEAIRIGIPTGIQNLLFSLASVALQGLINSHGSVFMAGFNGANKIDAFAFLPLISFSAAVTTYVGQNIGAGLKERVNKGVKAGLMLTIGVSIAIAVVLMPLGRPLMRLFSQDPAVIDAGVQYLNRVLPFYAMLGTIFILNGALRGAGETFVPMIGSLISMWLARVPAAYILAHYFGGLTYIIAIQ